jgi:hypothetical protein
MTDSSLIALAIIVGINLLALGFILGGEFAMRHLDKN